VLEPVGNLEFAGARGGNWTRDLRITSIYTKELRPLLMAAVIDSSYRISGEVFKVDDLKRLVNAIDHFEGHKAAQLFVLFVACRLSPEAIPKS